MIEIYVIISAFFGWAFLSRIQSNFVIFTTISNYIVMKIMISLFIGWLVAPFYVLFYVFKLFTRKKKYS